jgi:hypothetical protein
LRLAELDREISKSLLGVTHEHEVRIAGRYLPGDRYRRRCSTSQRSEASSVDASVGGSRTSVMIGRQRAAAKAA